jgi:hypothetical protein
MPQFDELLRHRQPETARDAGQNDELGLIPRHVDLPLDRAVMAKREQSRPEAGFFKEPRDGRWPRIFHYIRRKPD